MNTLWSVCQRALEVIREDRNSLFDSCQLNGEIPETDIEYRLEIESLDRLIADMEDALGRKEWQHGSQLSPEQEKDYLKDLCNVLREQETLSETRRDEDTDRLTCEIVPDQLAAHAADVIEELYERIEKLEYELREEKTK